MTDQEKLDQAERYRREGIPVQMFYEEPHVDFLAFAKHYELHFSSSVEAHLACRMAGGTVDHAGRFWVTIEGSTGLSWWCAHAPHHSGQESMIADVVRVLQDAGHVGQLGDR